MSVMDGFYLYNKLHELSQKVQQDVYHQTIFGYASSRINYKVLAEIHPEFGEECYVSKEVPKDVFINHVYSLIS